MVLATSVDTRRGPICHTNNVASKDSESYQLGNVLATSVDTRSRPIHHTNAGNNHALAASEAHFLKCASDCYFFLLSTKKVKSCVG
jgi:hypothetical protein